MHQHIIIEEIETLETRFLSGKERKDEKGAGNEYETQRDKGNMGLWRSLPFPTKPRI